MKRNMIYIDKDLFSFCDNLSLEKQKQASRIVSSNINNFVSCIHKDIKLDIEDVIQEIILEIVKISKRKQINLSIIANSSKYTLLRLCNYNSSLKKKKENKTKFETLLDPDKMTNRDNYLAKLVVFKLIDKLNDFEFVVYDLYYKQGLTKQEILDILQKEDKNFTMYKLKKILKHITFVTTKLLEY